MMEIIGVVVGVIIGFGLSILKELWDDRKSKCTVSEIYLTEDVPEAGRTIIVRPNGLGNDRIVEYKNRFEVFGKRGSKEYYIVPREKVWKIVAKNIE